MRIKALLICLLCAQCVLVALGPGSASANRDLISRTAVKTTECDRCPPPKPGEPPIPPKEGQIEGPCGLAVHGTELALADYYHRDIDIYSIFGDFESQFHLPGENPVFGINSLDAICGLAFDGAGNLYGNEFHEAVLRLKPTMQIFDTKNSTGVAVDESGNVYANDRTYVAVYQPSGEPLEKEAHQLRIGIGSLEDAYGLAVLDGRVYVPDAGDNTVKVFEPAVSDSDPVATIAGPAEGEFNSLVDAAVAVDPTNEHLLVVDNLKPGFLKPASAVYEFSASGEYLDRLPEAPIDGEPSGIAVEPFSGTVFVTDGNSEKSNVFSYGPYVESSFAAEPPQIGGGAPNPQGAATLAGSAHPAAAAHRGGASVSVVVQRGGVRVSFDGKLTPHTLPRHGTAPVGIAVDAKIMGTGDGPPPQLRRIAIAINRNGQLRSNGLPICRTREIQPSTNAGALAACGSALVGEGHFSASVQLPEQSPFPSEGKVLAFNGRLHGKPAILAHIYGTQPAPTSYVLPFAVDESSGTYGTVLKALLPQATGNWGYVTGLRMNLRRRFSVNGKSRSYLSAGCPAPSGFPGAVFPLARTSFVFSGGTTLISILNRSCTARG